MHFCVDHSVLKMFPQVKIGVLVGTDLNNHNPSQEITALLRSEEEAIRKKYQLEDLAALAKVSDWREAYRAFGFKPSSYRSSVEALLRRVLQNKELPSINPIVDLYNLISITHCLPAGGDDLDQVNGEIMLTIASGTEHFVMLGAEECEEIKKGEVIYRDEQEVLCRCWNYRECEKTKITENTKNVCLVLEGLKSSSEEEIKNSLSALQKLLERYCQGKFQIFFLNREHPEIFFNQEGV